ncbi:MAG TPA: hypothetical protein PLR99_15110 [Polyangiaceae bacterium]|nr:hypothetical protein [Polyangiaceae bacterium]
MSDLALRYAFAFVATQLVECPIYARGPLRGHRRPVVAAFGASLLTHPFAALLLPALLGRVVERPVWVPGVTTLTADFALRVAAFGLVSEGFAVLVEAAYLRALGVRRAFGWSLLANGASAGLGAALTLTLGFP